MNMPTTTVAVGFLLLVQGVGFYFGTGTKSVTALIPAFAGVPLLACGVIAMRESARKSAMHMAAATATLAFLAAVGRVASVGVSTSPAGISVLLLAAISGLFLAICIRSFIDARRQQKGT